MSDVISEVANELTQPGPQDRPTVELHFGTVTAVDTGAATISVEIGEDTAVAGMSYLASYAPVVNDKVVLFRAGPGALVVIGSYRPLAGAALLYGVGTPEGTVAAPVGVLYRRTDGGVNTVLYVKQTGTGDTGWGAVPTTNSSPNFTGSVTATGLTVNGAATVTGAASTGGLTATGLTLNGNAVITGTGTVDGNFRAGSGSTPVRLTGNAGPLTTPAIQFNPDAAKAEIWSGGADNVSTNHLGCEDLSATGSIVSDSTVIAEDGNAGQVRIGAYPLTTIPSVLLGSGTDAGMNLGEFGDCTVIRGRCQSSRFEHTGTLLGFYGHTVVSRPGAYSQPAISGSASADRNCPDWGAPAPGSPYDPWFGGDYADNDNLNALALVVNDYRTHLINLTQMVNQLLDDLQANGLVA